MEIGILDMQVILKKIEDSISKVEKQIESTNDFHREIILHGEVSGLKEAAIIVMERMILAYKTKD